MNGDKLTSEEVVTIRRILQDPSAFSGWLYLPALPWTLETEGAFAPYTKDDDEDSIPEAAKRNDWTVTLDSDAIEDIVENASDQVSEPTIDQLFEAFAFYYENDAFILL
ncbi:hypothetical protein AB1286_31915 [Trinickia sp. NRRL B-1857]|uniref:DUF7716 domain-containing protein n=1 Tax=Trinickia sp. NRRL B-1857 TaxID=3162879 RepID=UPI003D2964B2